MPSRLCNFASALSVASAIREIDLFFVIIVENADEADARIRPSKSLELGAVSFVACQIVREFHPSHHASITPKLPIVWAVTFLLVLVLPIKLPTNTLCVNGLL